MSGLRCRACGATKISVADTRPRDDLRIRRYRCAECGGNFLTVEIHLEVYEKLSRALQLLAKEKNRRKRT